MAIVKASYTRKGKGAKASIRYIQNRAGKDGAKTSRTLFGIDGLLGRWQAYRMIDEAQKGSLFYRFVISPDPKGEDTEKDLLLREVTEQTMHALEELLETPLSWVAAEHADHAPHRHVHVVAVVPGKLNVQDFQRMRQSATAACLEQRKQRDLAQEQNARGSGRGSNGNVNARSTSNTPSFNALCLCFVSSRAASLETCSFCAPCCHRHCFLLFPFLACSVVAPVSAH